MTLRTHLCLQTSHLLKCLVRRQIHILTYSPSLITESQGMRHSRGASVKKKGLSHQLEGRQAERGKWMRRCSEYRFASTQVYFNCSTVSTCYCCIKSGESKSLVHCSPNPNQTQVENMKKSKNRWGTWKWRSWVKQWGGWKRKNRSWLRREGGGREIISL